MLFTSLIVMALLSAASPATAQPAGPATPAPTADDPLKDLPPEAPDDAPPAAGQPAADPSTTASPVANDTGAPTPPPVRDTPAVGAVSLTDAERFRRGQNLFEYGDCDGVVGVLGDFTLGTNERDERQLVEAHRMLGVCYYQLGRASEGNRELKSLLYLSPDYELDPFLTPPDVIDRFETLKSELDAKLKEIRKARKERETLSRQKAERVIVERREVVTETPLALVLLPLGLAQWTNGQPAMAVLFFFVQALPLLVNVAAFWSLQLVREGPFKQFSSPDRNQQLVLEYSLFGTHIGALAVFGMVYVVSVGQAWFFREESISVEERTVRPNASE